MSPPPFSRYYLRTYTVRRPLFSKSSEVSKRLKLLRHTGSGDQKYRLIVTTEKRGVARRSPQHSKPYSLLISPVSFAPVKSLTGAR